MPHITQTMIDLTRKWQESTPEERWNMCFVMHDAYVEGGFPNVAKWHFNRIEEGHLYTLCCMDKSCDAIKYVVELDNSGLLYNEEVSIQATVYKSKGYTPRW